MRVLILFLLLLVAGPGAWAQPQITFTPKEITKWGAYPRTFSPVTFVDEDHLLIGFDSPPFTIKKKGIIQRIWLVRFDANWKVDTVKSYDLKLGGILEQCKLSPDHKLLVLVTKRGSRMDTLNLADGAMTTVMNHVAGEPGFRLDPSLCFPCGNSFYAIGYPYDANNYGGNATMAKVNLSQTGAGAFQPQLALDPIQAGVTNTTIRSLLNPEGVFLIHRTGDTQTTVTRWTPAGSFQVFDQGLRTMGSWGAQEYILYAMARAGDTFELVWGNAKTGQKKIVGSSSNRFINPVMSHEGNTWVVLEEQDKARQRFNVMAGSDQHPEGLVKLASNVPGCVLRVGTQGEAIVTYSVRGELNIFKMP